MRAGLVVNTSFGVTLTVALVFPLKLHPADRIRIEMPRDAHFHLLNSRNFGSKFKFPRDSKTQIPMIIHSRRNKRIVGHLGSNAHELTRGKNPHMISLRLNFIFSVVKSLFLLPQLHFTDEVLDIHDS